MKTFANYFDKIYVINLLSRTDRREFIINEFKAMGMYDSLISANKLEFVDAVPIPNFNNETLQTYKETTFSNIGSVGLFNCTIEHYRTLKRALYYGYERILILEDDACFIKDLNEVFRALDFMPDNFTLLHLEGYYQPTTYYPTREDWDKVLTDDIKDAYWHDNKGLKMWGAAAIIYSKRGMEMYTKMQEDFFNASDYPTLVIDDNAYFYTTPIIIQENKDYLAGDITVYTPDADSTNVYTSKIDRQNYYHIWEF